MQPAKTQYKSISVDTNSAHSSSLKPRHFNKLGVAILTAGMLALTGCQTVKGVFDKDDEAVTSAKQSDAAYYAEAVESLDKGYYLNASELLGELRTFYPTSPYAEQALLDLMYSQFNSKEYELAVGSAEQFIKLYPNNAQLDYAYYVRGVSNMQAGKSTLLHLAKLQHAHRDTAYMRLAFSNFQELITRFPNSQYATDAAKRMGYIYNQLAESEMTVARWYIEREAYVAAANRAKWVFQYFPQSPQIPEAIAILAYSYEQLGVQDLSQEYKTLLQINYPEWLTQSGKIKLDSNRGKNLLNTLTFGMLGRSNHSDDVAVTTPYTQPTKTQLIQGASQLQLPETTVPAASTQGSLPAMPARRTRGVNIGLGLPDEDAGLLNEQNSKPVAQQTINTHDILHPEMTPTDATSSDDVKKEGEQPIAK